MHKFNRADLPQELSTYPSIHVQPVAWGDMDAFGHVNNVVYYRYAESTRIHYLTEVEAFAEDVVTVLAHSSCSYLKPVTYPDTLWIGARSKSLGKTSLVMEYAFYSTAQQCIVTTGEAVVVRLTSDATQKRTWQPEEIERIVAHDGAVGHTPQLPA